MKLIIDVPEVDSADLAEIQAAFRKGTLLWSKAQPFELHLTMITSVEEYTGPHDPRDVEKIKTLRADIDTLKAKNLTLSDEIDTLKAGNDRLWAKNLTLSDEIEHRRRELNLGQRPVVVAPRRDPSDGPSWYMYRKHGGPL